ncbi:hypothetical protein ScPMuIL_017409 [Solemya velum]
MHLPTAYQETTVYYRVKERTHEIPLTDCKEDLLEDVADADISASDSYGPPYGPERARLTTVEAQPEYNGGGSWIAHPDDLDPYIQVKFNNTKLITGISTKGRNSRTSYRWVTWFSVLHSTDGASWVTVQDADCNVMFKGNVDRDSLVKNRFSQHFRAQYVRVRPLKSKVHPGMRFGVSGCDLVCMYITIK